ncbi:hypothetical protein PCC8801_3967 [Rippkaea orientalis PCC 8801]|uniref:DUF1579 domain-containing protein n=1 Tax=Rippkaea orientalis (strain PCC 8801 / RF-1) TaxID=41431 RepID=B7K582_RIPO1|nr:hypothetical protein [Rippkaea orientalis]ACK67908.1 hypothetical protein PCC8801_3967 [Rippkaea orientalis PCC 8801]
MINVDTNHVPEIFTHHIGTWKGEYIKTDTKGHFSRSFWGSFTFNIEGINYDQVNYYEYADGGNLTLHFSGTFHEGILSMKSISYDDFSATAWDSGENTIIFRAEKTQNNDKILFLEMINLITPTHRVRCTQAFKNGVFDGVSFIEETKS